MTRRPSRIPVESAVEALVKAGADPDRIEIDLVNHRVYVRDRITIAHANGGAKTNWDEAVRA